MPIQPQLLRGLRPIQAPDVMGRAQAISGLRSQQIAQQKGENDLEQQAKARAIHDVIIRHNGDFEKALPELRMIDPQMSTQFETLVNARADRAEAQTDKRSAREVFARKAAQQQFSALEGTPAETAQIDIPGVEVPREVDFPAMPSAGLPGFKKQVPSIRDVMAQKEAQRRQALALTREANTYTITDPTSGKTITAPKDILDNVMTQSGLNARQGQQDSQFNKTLDAAAQRHRETMEQRRLDREQRATSARETRTDMPPTAANLRTFGFYMRAADAVETLSGIESDIAAMGLREQAWQKFAPNFLQSQIGQTYEQAQRQFTEARLRKDSGAAIPEHEYTNDKKTYFVQPGDTKETLERKRKAREVLTNALKNESGRAYTQSFGEDSSTSTGPRTQASDSKGNIIEWDGKAWVPVKP